MKYIAIMAALIVTGCSTTRFEVESQWGEVKVPMPYCDLLWVVYYPDVDFAWAME